MNQHNHEIKEIQRSLLLLLEDILLKDKQKIDPKNDKNYLPYDGQAIESNLKKILELKGKRSEDDKIITFENDKYKFIKESSKIYVINKQNGSKIFEKGHFTKWASNEDAHYLKNIQTLTEEIIDELEPEKDVRYSSKKIESSIEQFINCKGVENDDESVTYDTKNYKFIKDESGDISVINKQTGEVIFRNGGLTKNASDEDVENLNSFQEYVEEFIDSLGESESQTQKINYSPSLKLTS